MRPFWADTDTPVVTLPFVTTAVSILLASTNGVLLGFSLIETTGAASAQIDFLDGTDARGTLLAPVALNAGQSVRDPFGMFGIAIERGLFLQVNSGSVRGVAYVVRQ